MTRETANQAAQSPSTGIAICIPTYKRPDLLHRLLDGLSVLRFDKCEAPEIVVVVVDNDASRSAEEICHNAQLPWTLKYVAESRRGIAQTRNRAIREAGSLDFIAFIDDDETTSPIWLDELLNTQRSFDADVVFGPVLPDFGKGVPGWIRNGHLFDRPVGQSGHPPKECRSGNVLVRKEVFLEIGEFDERFALTGGEDTQFFLRVRRAHHKIVSSPQAVTYEDISISRANLTWILRRAYQSGNSWVLCECSLDCGLSTRLVRLLKACGWIAAGSLSLCTAPLFGMAAIARSLRNICLGAGMLMALAGQSYEAYQSAGVASASAEIN
jgi:succinoglycan biosynthesis protein ExoM